MKASSTMTCDEDIESNLPAPSTVSVGEDNEHHEKNTADVESTTTVDIKTSSETKTNVVDDDVQDDGITIAGTDVSDGAMNLPEFLICPIKRALLVDPVVLQDGLSYERSAVLEQKPAEPIIYPNRALAGILAEIQNHPVIAASRSTNSNHISCLNDIVGKPKSFIPKQSFLQQAKQFFTANEDRPLPESLYCPITLGIMHEPVIDPDGNSFERVAIINWIRVNGESPVTRKALTVEELVENRSIQQLLQTEVDRENIDDIHPALRRWKNEPVPHLPPALAQQRSISSIANGQTSHSRTVDGVTSSTSTVISPMPFPTTRIELEAQMEQSRRRRQNRMKLRIATCIVLLMLLVASFFVPILAAINVVFLMAAIWCFMSDSARNHSFR